MKHFDKLITLFFSKRVVILLLIGSGLIFVISLWNRYIQSDENWFGEQAYWLLHDGVVKIKSMRGILGFDKRMFVYHQLFVFIGAALIKYLGWSVYVLKNFILLVYMLFFLLYYFFIRKHTQNSLHFLIAVLLIFICPVMTIQSYVFRPEVLVMTIGFIAYIFLDLYLKENKKRFVLLAALFAGMAFLTTYNGLAFPVAGVAVLLFQKKYKGLFLFSITACAVCLLSSWELWEENNFDVFMFQFKNWPTWKFGETYMDSHLHSFFLKKIMALANIFQFFFWSDRVLFFSLIFFIALISRFRMLWQQHRSVLIYFAGIILSLDLFGSFIAERYLIYVFPYMAFVSGLVITNTSKNKIYKILFFLVFIVQIPFCVKTYIKIFSLNNNHVLLHSQVVKAIHEKNVTVVAPWCIIFNEIDKQDFVSYKAIEYYEDDTGKKMNGKELFDIISQLYGAKYIIVQRTIKNEPDWYPYWFDNMDVLMNHSAYVLMKTMPDFFIFKAR